MNEDLKTVANMYMGGIPSYNEVMRVFSNACRPHDAVIAKALYNRKMEDYDSLIAEEELNIQYELLQSCKQDHQVQQQIASRIAEDVECEQLAEIVRAFAPMIAEMVRQELEAKHLVNAVSAAANKDYQRVVLDLLSIIKQSLVSHISLAHHIQQNEESSVILEHFGALVRTALSEESKSPAKHRVDNMTYEDCLPEYPKSGE